MVKAGRNIIFVACFVACLLLLTFICEDAVIFERTETVVITNVDFESDARDPRLAAVKVFPQVDDPSSFKAVDIHLKMKAHSMTGYNNLFQTAPENAGIRLELAGPSTLGLVVGNEEARPGGFKGYILTRSIQPGKWYTVGITITRNKRLRVSIDNTTVVDSLERGLGFSLSDIAVGTGFSRTRPFDGSIEDFSMTYRFFRKNYSMQRAFLMFKIVLISGLVGLILVSLPTPQAGPQPSVKIGIAGIIILIGFALSVFYHYAYLGWKYPFDLFLSNPGSSPNYAAFIMFTLLPGIVLVGYNYRKVSGSLPPGAGKTEIYTYVLIFSLLTYPFLLAFSRGSSELLVFVLLALFVHFFSLKRFFEAACSLAVAAAFEVYPLIFLALFATHKKYKPALFSILLTAVVIAAAFLLSGRTPTHLLSIPSLIDLNTWVHVSPRSALAFNSSLFGGLHFLTVSLFHVWSVDQFAKAYLCITPILFLPLIYYLVAAGPDLCKQLLFLSIAALLLVPVSPDDRLLVLLIPFWFFAQNQSPRPSDVFYIISIAALLIPNHYLVIYQGTDQAGPFYAAISTVLNPFIMGAILSKGVSEALKTRRIYPTQAL